jgi:putative hydrolase of the HAD superfamily
MLRRLLAQTGIAPHRAVLVEDTLSHLKRYAGTGIRTAWVTGYLRTIAPSRPLAVPASETAGSRRDAAVRSTLEAEGRRHASHATQEHSVTLVAAEAQVPPAAGGTALAPQSQPDHAPRVRARVPNRPAYVDIKVQSMHQLQQRLRRTGS